MTDHRVTGPPRGARSPDSRRTDHSVGWVTFAPRPLFTWMSNYRMTAYRGGIDGQKG